MTWDLVFEPILAWPLTIALACAGLALVAVTLALFDPAFRNEDRDNLSDIAIAVVDKSQSQEFGNRNAQTDAALAALKAAVARLGNVELRVVTARSGITAGEDGTHLFSALDGALAEVPHDRFAGAVFITDGQVHDVPADPGKLGLNAPLHALLTGGRHEVDRRIVLEQSPRFGIV